MAVVHLDRYWRGPLAKGMSFPTRTGMIVPLFERRPENNIYLKMWYSDRVKDWSKRGAAERLKHDATLLCIEFDRTSSWKLYKARSSSTQSGPGWWDEQDPCLVDVHVYSLPAENMREGSLTKERIATLLPMHLAALFPRRINENSVRLSYSLNAPKKKLIVRFEAKPVRKWEHIRTENVPLEAE